jgi:hypothetical protein
LRAITASRRNTVPPWRRAARSCHGYHKILPSSDTNSTINKIHLVETCGKCHPGANAEFSLGKIHVAPDGQAGGHGFWQPLNRWVRRIYLFLIFATIGGMLAHNGILFVKKTAARLRMTERPVVRMTASQRWQHFVLATSFIVLAVTGFALKFPDSWLAKILGSNEPFRRWTHRIAGHRPAAGRAYHLIYLLATRDGRKLVADLFPVKKTRWMCGRRCVIWPVSQGKTENRPLRLRGKNGILGRRLGHDHHGRDRSGRSGSRLT